jgi:Tol biopolymer transport system component
LTVTAPPRPPRPGDPVDRDELEALVNALIEEARRRAQRRRRIYTSVVALVALAGVGAFVVVDRTAWSQTASPELAARCGLAAGASTSQIAFMRSTVGQDHKELYVMNTDGSGQRLLAREAGLGDMAWSHDGRDIVFLRGGRWDRGALMVVAADGSEERRLTGSAAAWTGGFDWVSDRRIAYTRVRGHYRDIWVMNADGSGQRRLAQRGTRPQWSPDGRQISFASRRDGNWEIYAMNADGSSRRRLTHNSVDDYGAAWSPDGHLISFSRQRDSGGFDLFVMNADGTGQRRLARNAAWSGGPVAWSLDGLKIAFARPSPGTTDIYVMNADGGGVRNLTRSPGLADSGPTWSPDGRKIAFVTWSRLSDGDLYAINADGSGKRRLVRNAAWLAWSPAQTK